MAMNKPNENDIKTTNGETWTVRDSSKLAFMIYIRFGRDVGAAAAAWRRLLQNSCPDSAFKAMVEQATGWDIK